MKVLCSVFENAVKWQEKALNVAPKYLEEQFQAMLDLFRSGNSYREEAEVSE